MFGETPKGSLCNADMVADTISFIIDSNKYTYSERKRPFTSLLTLRDFLIIGESR